MADKDKVEFEFELTGLKIKFKGNRSELPSVGSHLSNQLSGMLESGADLASGESPAPKRVENTADADSDQASVPKKKRRRRKAASDGESTGSGGSQAAKQIEALIAEGYFTEERTLGDMREHLRVNGYSFESSDISPVMTRLTRSKSVSRRKDADKNQYVYFVNSDESK